MIDFRYFTPLTTITDCVTTERGIRASVDGATVEVEILSLDAFRITITPEHGAQDSPQYAICGELEPCEFKVTDEKKHVVISTKNIKVQLAKRGFAVNATRSDGSTIFNSSEGYYARLNDSFAITRSRTDSDVVLGLGEKTGRFNRAGQKYTLWNVDVLNQAATKEIGLPAGGPNPRHDPSSTEFDPYYMSIPFYHSVSEDGKAAGFFIDNLCQCSYDFSQEGITRIRFEGGLYSEIVFAGPTLGKVLEDYTQLTGRMPSPPLWSLGYHHCRWHPYSQDDVIKHADTYRKKKIPCDSIWLDIDHMDGYRVFTWNKKLMPEPAKMLEKLKERGFRSVTIIDPGVKVEPGYAVYDSGLKLNAFCLTEGGAVYQGQVWPGKTAFPDFVSEAAREWWGDLNAKHVEFGLAGIWNDMNEPATGDIPCGTMRFGGGKYSHGMVHNAYALLMAMGTVDGLRKAQPDLRTFVLSRGGSAGIQRYAANWLGDNMARWDHLRMSIPMSLGLGLSGQPFIGADIGGFCENSNSELLIRWMQAATLSPFCRNHNDARNVDQYPWSFGAKAERACKAAIELRYKLMPYIYSSFVESSETGVPIMRPFVLEDTALSHIEDAYLFGPSLLVAPIMAPGVTSRSVTLPPGQWIDWHTGDTCSGTVWIQAPLDRIPIFARAGAVIPMWTEAPPSTMGYQPETLDLHVVLPTKDGEYVSTLVEDDGESFGYEKGDRLVTKLTLIKEGKDLKLVGETSGNTFAGFKRNSFRVVVNGKVLATVTADLTGFAWQTTLKSG